MTVAETAAETANPVEALVGRLFGEGVATMHLLTVYLGVRLGLYAALDGRRLSADELAEATGLDTWYVREWLQAEMIAGLVAGDGDDPSTARFTLSDGVRETLIEETSPAYLGGLPFAAAAVGGVLPALLDAFRTGSGIPYAAYGPEAVTAQASLNRPAFTNALVTDWVPAIPGLLDRLRDSGRPARIADIGCGAGWAAIELAKAFPGVRVDGYDADEASISAARRNAAEHGVADRARFEVADAKAGGYGGHRYDALFFFECLHDFGRPVEALGAARAALAPDGIAVVMDERVGEHGPDIGSPTESFFSAASVLWCLPQSRAEPDCEAPGTIMRPATLTTFAKRAGWSEVSILPIEHPFWRFYRLHR